MYAVVTTGGKQYRVAEGDVLRVESLAGEPGDTLELNEVSLIAGADGIVVGDALGSAKVLAQVVSHGRRKKIRVFKYKRRKNYRRTAGHRQDYTELRVTAIQA
jgi:large subunit ribosomal protein L21